LTTDHDRIRVQLPPGTVVGHVGLDGRRVDLATNADEEVVNVRIPEPGPEREHVVEIWSTGPRAASAAYRMTLQAPQVVGAQWTKRSYWQLALPSHEHLIGLPASATAELSWKHKWPLWEKRSRLQQEDLERWSGASLQEPLPAALNQYLFSSFDTMPEITVITARRGTILLLVCGCALLAGLLAMHYSLFRHPIVFLLAGGGLAAAVLIYPDLSIFAVQVSPLGLVLVLIAWLIKWLVDLRESKRSVIRGATLAGPDSKTVRVPMPRGDSSSFPASTTAQAGIHLPVAEPKP
jgi:hypothetical protein